MRFIIPIVIILTLASCTNKSKLLEKCADEDFLKDYGIVEQYDVFSRQVLTDKQYLYEVDFVESIREGSISLQKKLSGTNFFQFFFSLFIPHSVIKFTPFRKIFNT